MLYDFVPPEADISSKPHTERVSAMVWGYFGS